MAILIILILKSKSTDYLCISFSHLQLTSSVFYGPQCIGLSPPWLRLFLGFLFFFDKILNRMFFLLSLSDISLGYKNTITFCILILNPENLLNSFILIVLDGNFRVLNIEYHVICKCDNFISPLSICVYFISFSCLISMDRASSTILNNSDQKKKQKKKQKNSDKNGHPCLLPEFRRKAFSFSPLNIMLALILS